MNATEIMEQVLNDGVAIQPDNSGSIRLVGDESMVQKWLPVIRENKVAILEVISPRQRPTPCQGCSRFETVEITGKAEHGCLYIAQGEYFDGWRRIPQDLNKCLFN